MCIVGISCSRLVETNLVSLGKDSLMQYSIYDEMFLEEEECTESMSDYRNPDHIYYIHEDFFPSVEKKLNRIANKCKKYGNPFTFDVLGSEMRQDKGIWHKFIIVEVEGTAHIDNWEFVATLDIRANGNIIRRYNTEVEIPECYKTSPNICDHCRSARPRKNLYLIRNTESGEFKQVGGSCLNSYTNGLDLEYVVSWIDGLRRLEEYSGVFYGAGGRTYHNVKEVIFYAHVITEKIGYLKNDYYSDSLSTKGMVSTMLRSDIYAGTVEKRVELLNNQLKDHLFEVSFTVSDFAYDPKKIQPVIDYYKGLEDNSEFNHNVKVILEEGYAEYKDLGYLCYLPQGYAKHIEREIERATRLTEKHEHWGEVGKRYKNVPVRNIRKAGCYETVYGLMYVWNIVTEDGTILTWKTSNFPEGEISAVTFTVKEHGEYKGTKQTIVTRCKFESKAA